MNIGLLLEYGWVLIVLIGLEGVLAADNALVMSIMVKHLPDDKRKKALFYGLAGAFVFRFGSLFIISFLADVWYVQALGALYLLYISINHIVKQLFVKRKKHLKEAAKKNENFWVTVLKVELADIAFAVDAILAAVALALTLPPSGLPNIGGLDGGQFLVILTGGLIGLVIMRFAATYFVKLLARKPGLETAAFLIVGWVGIKLAVYTLAHPDIAILSESFPKSTGWKLVFWGILILIAVLGWFLSKDKGDMTEAERQQVEN
ncbi:TerC family protein [Paenibacillus sp. JCM 10914]|uniref:TerC family protein n=1 Tax=Paenibacillus sp. JCM 10914 TaxID=1236974 RepID=UPI0003CC5BFA|nr:TerC family protein [Paenibacillus sp. JCM 10914]GAE09052.1 TerC-like integral membrane protein [Paenibacillus sp. JCM 10914]